MTLGWGEKAGLQIYRNYTKSFERHAVGKLREALNQEKIDLSGLEKLVGQLAREDLRFVPIILCAFADDILEAALKAAVPDTVPGGKAKLFDGYGPLSDLAKRTQMAAAFDVLSGDLMTDLDRVRQTRNKISHSWDTDTFSDFYVGGRVADLFPIESLLAERAAIEPELGAVLDAGAAFRVRAIWLAGRLKYEASFYALAKKARLSPTRTLYGDGGTEWLTKVGGICLEATKSVIRAATAS